ncbi:MAG TPA: radical SAM protein [Thermoanaerobaculia bacterium]|nr:radical SAM protein [Thermoanaerobaculia bacterium]
MPLLQVTEIFKSLQGESTRAGFPCSFVRLTGCSLRCAWCDSAYAFHGGRPMTIDAVVAEVEAHGTRLVELTGGEPLEQEAAYPLMTRLLDAGKTVLVETGGHVPLDRLDPRAIAIMDVKAPGSGMAAFNLDENLARLRPSDELKFVLADRADFDWAIARVAQGNLDASRVVTFSPVWDRLPGADLAEWILESGCDIRLGLPLHKLLWGDVPGR